MKNLYLFLFPICAVSGFWFTNLIQIKPVFAMETDGVAIDHPTCSDRGDSRESFRQASKNISDLFYSESAVTIENHQPIFRFRHFGAFKGKTLECKLWTLPAGQQLYHWGHPKFEDTMKPGRLGTDLITERGKVSNQDYEAALKQEDLQRRPQSGDTGFYMSLDPLDSMMYGPKLLVSTLDSDQIFIDPKHCNLDIDHEDLLEIRAALGSAKLRELGIVGIRQSNFRNWLFSIDERATSNMRAGTLDDILSDSFLVGEKPDILKLCQLDRVFQLPANHEWIVRQYPLINKLISGSELSRSEKAEIISTIPDIFRKNSRTLLYFNALNVFKNINTPLSKGLDAIGFVTELQAEVDRYKNH